MSEEEGEGEVCEVCKDSTFVATFCKVIGGDKECIELTERAGRGEITQEQYYARVIEKYGREKVGKAMEKALVKDRLESAINPAAAAEAKPKAVQPAAAAKVPNPEVPKPEKEQSVAKAGGISKEEEKLATGIADDKEKNEMEERAKAGMPKFKTVLKGMCLPCIGEPASAVMSVVKLWYTGKDKEKIEKLVVQMRAGEIMVEDALKEVLKLPSGKDCVNSTLADFNKLMEISVESALRENPDLQEDKKGK